MRALNSRRGSFSKVEGLVGVVTKESLLSAFLYLLICDILNCFCKNLVFKLLHETLLISLHLTDYRCKYNLIKELFCGIPARIHFISNVTLYLYVDQKMLGYH
jgi:hypothetical protein